MVFDDAERVEKLHCEEQPSGLVQAVAKYIQQHLFSGVTRL